MGYEFAEEWALIYIKAFTREEADISTCKVPISVSVCLKAELTRKVLTKFVYKVFSGI